MLEIIGQFFTRAQTASSKGPDNDEREIPPQSPVEPDFVEDAQDTPTEIINKPLLDDLISMERESKLHAERQACLEYLGGAVEESGIRQMLDKKVLENEQRMIEESGIRQMLDKKVIDHLKARYENQPEPTIETMLETVLEDELRI